MRNTEARNPGPAGSVFAMHRHVGRLHNAVGHRRCVPRHLHHHIRRVDARQRGERNVEAVALQKHRWAAVQQRHVRDADEAAIAQANQGARELLAHLFAREARAPFNVHMALGNACRRSRRRRKKKEGGGGGRGGEREEEICGVNADIPTPLMC